MRIGKVAQAVGFSVSTIRRAERDGAIPPAPRDQAGHRRYSEKDVETIRRVLFPARSAGNGTEA